MPVLFSHTLFTCPSPTSIRASAGGPGSKCPHSRWCFCISDWRQGWEMQKSHCHEYSCKSLSMHGVCFCVLWICFRLNAPVNEFLVNIGERLPSDGNFSFVVIIYCPCIWMLHAWAGRAGAAHAEWAQPLPQGAHMLMQETRSRWGTSGKRAAFVVTTVVSVIGRVTICSTGRSGFWHRVGGQASWEKAERCCLEKQSGWWRLPPGPTGEDAEWEVMAGAVSSEPLQQEPEVCPGSRSVPAICMSSQKGLKCEFPMSSIHSDSVTRKLQSKKHLWKSFGGVLTITVQHLGKSSTCSQTTCRWKGMNE